MKSGTCDPPIGSSPYRSPRRVLLGGTSGATLDRAVVIYLAGDVTATRGSQTKTVAIGDALAEGQTLHTGARSECELRLGNGTAIRIEERTDSAPG